MWSCAGGFVRTVLSAFADAFYVLFKRVFGAHARYRPWVQGSKFPKSLLLFVLSLLFVQIATGQLWLTQRKTPKHGLGDEEFLCNRTAER